MLFNSVQFLLFFPAVCLLYFPLPQALKKPWLLVCSYYFYMCWDARFALLIAVSTLSTWGCGFLLERSKRPKARKWALAADLVINLGILFLFKYFDFFSGSIASLLGGFGIVYRPLLLGWTLPVGISFYTFQALGYSIDIYRGDIPHEKNLLNYALFVSFFPQLVAGPIERAANFLPQLHERKYFDERRIGEGVCWMLWGYFKKVVIADGLAAFVDVVYAAPQLFSAQQTVLATVMFAVQLYCDFSAYSDIALGAAKVLGFTLMRNFDRPYYACNITDFWRRWHISLSGWLRDYLYIPLGGNRKGRLRKWLNLLITFLVSGLWHGANWTFVIWGGLNGLYQIVDDLVRPVKEKLRQMTHTERFHPVTGALGMLLTFALVCLSYVFFRAETVADAFAMLRTVFSGTGWTDGAVWRSALEGLGFFGDLPHETLAVGNWAVNSGLSLTLCVGLLALADALDRPEKPLIGGIGRCWFPVRWLFGSLLLVLILLFGSFAPSGFYYFQF